MNDALREVLIRMVGDVDARINGVNERVNSVLYTAELVWKRDIARVICMSPMAQCSKLPPCKLASSSI